MNKCMGRFFFYGGRNESIDAWIDWMHRIVDNRKDCHHPQDGVS